jgi:cytidylate kinase
VADDAVYIDSTSMTVDEVVGEMLRRLPGVRR